MIPRRMTSSRRRGEETAGGKRERVEKKKKNGPEEEDCRLVVDRISADDGQPDGDSGNERREESFHQANNQ